MKIDITLEANNPPERIAELARLAESYGVAGIWVSNMHDARDPFINFVDAARATSTIRLGPVAVSPYELHPLKMANALLTLNEIAGGRAQIGIAAGEGGTATAMGLPQKRRVRAVRECVEIINAASTAEPVKYEGEVYKVMYYHSSWVSCPPPVVYVCANGPQMLRSAAKYAEGIFTGDHLPEHIAEIRQVINPLIEATGRATDEFRMNNFWAWHVKESRAEALNEARIWLAARFTPWPSYYYRGILDEAEMQVVWDNIPALMKAYYERTPTIDGIPDEILTKLCDRCTSASALSDLDREIERLRAFGEAGLTNIALRVYENPDEAIRVIGERVIPAL